MTDTQKRTNREAYPRDRVEWRVGDRVVGPQWQWELEESYDARYPYNRATQYPSGHLIEVDETPGAERIHVQHRSGSYVEMRPDGSVQVRSQGNKYEVVAGQSSLKVRGAVHIEVDGDANVRVAGSADVETGSLTATVKGDMSASVRGSMTADVTGSTTIRSGSVSVDTASMSVTGDVTVGGTVRAAALVGDLVDTG